MNSGRAIAFAGSCETRGLPGDKSLANFDLKRLPTKVSRQMKVLLEGGFLERKENLLAFGNPGAGKSHLLCAIAQELISSQRRKIKYTTCALLVQDLLVAKRELQLRQEIKKLAKYEGLVIDQMGYVQQSREEMEFCSRFWRSVTNVAVCC